MLPKARHFGPNCQWEFQGYRFYRFFPVLEVSSDWCERVDGWGAVVNCGQMPMPQIHYEGWWLLLGVAVARRHAMFNRLFVEKNELSDPKTILLN